MLINSLIFFCVSLVLPDGGIKAEDSHSTLLHTTGIWFTACDGSSIVDSPNVHNEEPLVFEICQPHDGDEELERKMVYDKVNDYFKIITSVDQMNNVCQKNHSYRCHLVPLEAKVLYEDDHESLYIQIQPKWEKRRKHVLNVARVKGTAPYGKINMVRRSMNMDGRSTILKIHKLE